MNIKKINLSISDNITTLDESIKLDIGQQSIAKRYFKRELPTPYEIEMAIIEIEDAIESIQSYWSNLVKNFEVDVTASKNQFADLIELARVEEDTLTTQQLEQVFNRLADIVSGSPKQQNEFPNTAEFISSTLILRELMHHLSINDLHFV